VHVQQIDPDDAASFDAWYAVLRVTDEERWPRIPGWSRREIHAMASHAGGATEYQCLAATDETGATVGIGLFELARRDNLRRTSLDVRVLPGYRRRGTGTAIVAEAERRNAAEGRSMVNGFCEVPTDMLASDPSAPFARRLGFAPTQTAHRRHLSLPPDATRLAPRRAEVAVAAVGYRIFTFATPWPIEYLDDQCELRRRMSTDAPSGDAHEDEESWDAARVEEADDLLAAQGLTRLAAVAEHIDSGRLVAFTELALPGQRPTEAWQWATLVRREHRGHRLGLAVKLANLDYLATVFPEARLVITGNAQENAPMIAVNEMLGFEVAATATFWQKDLAAPQ
jgi:GNAT superfamily N-acetyltransferase